MFLITIALMYIYLKTIDKKYSQIIEKESNNFEMLQQITYNSFKNFHALKNIVVSDKNKKTDSLIKRWHLYTDSNTMYYNQVIKNTESHPNDKKSFDDLINTRKKYMQSVQILLQFYTAGQKDSCNNYLNNTVRSVFWDYQDKLNDFVEYHKNEILNFSKDISNDVNNKSANYVLLGFSPFLILLIIGIVYLIVMGILFLIIYIDPSDLYN